MRMRKKRRGEERLRALSALFLTEDDCKNPETAFYADLPLRLEIGCGKGEFVRKLSRRDDGYNYVALERVSDVIVGHGLSSDEGMGVRDN